MEHDNARRALPFSRVPPAGAGLWALLALGMLLLLAALAGAEERGLTATRTERFNATLASGDRLRVENVSGDIVASPGKEFSAVVTTTVTASTQARADEILRKTRIVSARDGNEQALETRWPEAESGGRLVWESRKSRPASYRCRDCRITTRYELTVPASAALELRTVNGDVESRGLTGVLELHSVNGAVRASGTRRSVTAETVNGRVEIVADALAPEAAVGARTINGSLLVTLPKEARFELSASTMNGTISSTFPLRSREESGEAEQQPASKDRGRDSRPRQTRRVLVQEGDDESVVLDIQELRRTLDESMKDVEANLRTLGDTRQVFRGLFPGREYRGSVGQGGAKVSLSALTGAITVLAAGTRETEAKALASSGHTFAVQIPRIDVKVHPVVVSPGRLVRIVPRVVAWTDGDEESVVQGDIAGDFLATTGGRTYRIGAVSGGCKILTHSGWIRVGSAGKDADLKTYGGDIRIGTVGGELKAQTLAGEIVAGSVTGPASLETSGGDIRVDSIGGSADARTGGGDIVLRSTRGAVFAKTGGGDLRVTVHAREPRGGISLQNSGGDVTLTLPADFRGQLDLDVQGSGGSDETFIQSEFPEIAVTRQRSSQSAAGTLNGGGARVVVHTRSGLIRLRKGPVAGG